MGGGFFFRPSSGRILGLVPTFIEGRDYAETVSERFQGLGGRRGDVCELSAELVPKNQNPPAQRQRPCGWGYLSPSILNAL